MANNFEYKIHISIDQNSVKGDVRDILKNMKSEIENGVYKVKLTGDPNNLLKQLSDLQKKMPDIDLTKGIQFGLADTINAQTEQGKKMLNEFVTFMTNAINNSMSNINNLKQQISSVEGSLKTSKGKLDLLGAGDANKALDNLTKKFKNIKAEEKNIGELRDVFQQIKDISSSIGKDLPKGVEEYQNKIQNTLKKDIFKDIVPSKTYAEYFQEASTEVLEFENKLVELKKELETAMNPEVKVKGKLSEGFISDLQSQLDSTDGIEVKVKPVVDKDFELELKANIKPNNNGNSGTNQIKKDADEINKKVEAAVSNFNLLQEHINKYKTNLDISKSGDSFMTYSSGENTSISHHVYDSDIRKGAPTYKSIKKELQEYLDIKKAVETGITKYGYENTFYNEKHIDMQLDKLAAYVYSLHNAQKAAELFGEKNKEVFDLVQKRIEQNIKASEARENLEHISGWIAGDLKRDYGVESVTLGQFDKLEEAINTGGIEAFAAKAKELFGVEIPTSVEQAKNSVEGFNQAASSDSTASAQDRTQSEFRETTEAAEETKKATSGAFSPEQLKQFTELLSTISGHLESIKGLIGTINETEGIKSLIDGFDILLLKIEEIQERVSGGLLNVNVNQEGMYGSGADKAIDKTLSDLRNRYDKVVQIFGDEDSMFNRFGVVGTNLQELYSKGSINGLDNAKMQIDRIREFFKEFRNLKEIIQAEIDNAKVDFDAYMNSITSGKDRKTNLSIEEIVRSAETSRKNKKASNLNTYEKEAYNRYLGIQEQEDVLAKLNKITAPAKSNAYLNSSIQKIQQAEVDEYARIQELGKADLSPVIEALKNIEKLLESISNKKIFDTESIDTFINRLNDVIEKIHSVTDASQEAVATSGQSTQGTKTQGSSDKDKTNDASKNAERKAAAEEKAIKAAERKAEAEERAAKAAEKKADAAEKKAAAEEKKAVATEKKAEAEEKRVAATEKRIAAEEKATKAAEEKAAKAAEEKATTDDKIFASRKEKAISDLNNKKINITEGFEYSNGLSDRISDVKSRIDSLRQSLESIKDSSGMKTWEAEFRTLSSLIKGVNASIKEEEKAFNDAANAAKKEAKEQENAAKEQEAAARKQEKAEQRLLSQRSALLKRLSVLMQNGGIMKDQQWGSYIREQFNLINSSADVSADKIREVGLELNRIETEANAAGKSGQTLFQLIGQRAKSLIAYLSTFASFYRVIGYIRSAFTTLKDLDTQLVDLRKTTTMTTSELDNFYKSSTNVGKELGVTTSEIISQAAAWSRLGYSSNEAATQMAELSSKFASISPGMSTDNATDYLVSTMKAFGIETDEVERKIMDNVNRIGNTFATTNAEIGEMLTRSSAAMKAANNTLEETIALETAAVEITRNAETTGTAFRTVSMRIRGLDEETEEALEDYEELKGKIADLTKTAKTPGGISLFTDETKKTYKSTYQILKEISEIYHDISDKDRASLLETIAGKRGGQVLAGLLNDFSQVDKALEEMKGAAGAAEAEMGIIRDSLDFKINALKQTWVGILQDLVERGTIGKLVDSLTQISEILGKLLNKAGLLKTAFIGIASIFGARSMSLGGSLKQFFVGDKTVLDNPLNKKLLDSYDNLKLGNVIEHEGEKLDTPEKLINAYNGADDSCKRFIKTCEEVPKKIRDGETAAQAFVRSYSSGLKQLGGTIVSVGKSLLKSFGKAALSGLTAFLVSEVISVAIKAGKGIYDEITGKAHKERTEESISNFNAQTNQYKKDIEGIDNVIEKYKELTDKINDNNISTSEELEIKTQLKDLQDQLVDSYGIEAENVDLVTGRYEHQLSVLKNISNEKAINFLYDPKTGIETKNKKDGLFGWFGEEKSDLDMITEYLYGIQEDTIKIGKMKNMSNLGDAFKNLYGFDMSILDKYDKLSVKEGSFNPLTNNIGIEFSASGTGKEINDQLTELFAELRRLYKDNPQVQAFISEVSSSLDYDFDLEKYNEALESSYTALDAKMTLTGSDNAGLKKRAEEAVKEYNEALADYESNRSDENKAYLESKKEDLFDVKKDVADFKESYEDYLGELAPTFDKVFGDIWDDIEVSASEHLGEYFSTRLKGGNFETIITNVIGNLNDAERTALEGLIDDSVEDITIDQFYGLIDEARKIAENNPIRLNIRSDFPKTMFEDFTTALSEQKEQGYLTAETLEKLNDAYGDLGKTINKTYERNISALDLERDKISEYGVEKYRSQIESKTVPTKFGNIDMDNRQIINYDKVYIENHKKALESWKWTDEDGRVIGNYYKDLSEAIANGEKVIDTVFGGVETFTGFDNKEYEIAFSPILQTENGAEMLSSDTVFDYIQSVLNKAGEDGQITADEIFTIDATDTGKEYGKEFGLGLIAGVNGVIDQEGTIIPEVGELMHFSGKYGAWQLAENSNEKTTYMAEYSRQAQELYTFTENGILLNTEAMSKYADQTAKAALVANELKEALAVKEYNKEAKALKALVRTDKDLAKAYAKGKDELKKYLNTTKNFNQAKKDEILASLDRLGTLADEINSYDMMEAQIRAATSALHDYIEATETPNLSDNFNTAKTAVESLKTALTNGWTGTDDFRKGMEYIGGYNFDPDIMEFASGKYQSNWAEVVEEYIKRGERYFTEDIQGIYNFLDDAVAKTEGMITKSAEGIYSINVEDIDEFAKKMDLSTSAAMDLLLATSDAWDFDVDFSNISDSIVDGLHAIDEESVDARTDMTKFREEIDALKEAGYDVSKLEEAYDEAMSNIHPSIEFNTELSEQSLENVRDEAEKYAKEVGLAIGEQKITFDADLQGTEQLISKVTEYRNGLKEGNSEYEHAQTVLAALLQQKHELEKPAILNIDSSELESETAGALSLLQEFYDAYSDYETKLTLGADTSDAEEKLNNVKQKLEGISSETAGQLGLGTIDFTADTSDIVEQLGKIDVNSIVGKNNTVEVKADTSGAKKDINKLTNDIRHTNAKIGVNGITKSSGFDSAVQSTLNSTTYRIKVSAYATGTVQNISLSSSGHNIGKSPTGGTGYINSGRSNQFITEATGTSSVPKTGNALVGELGAELVARDGKAFLVGQDGAEIIPLQKGDIVFNAEQTKQLLTTHKTNSQGQLIGSFASGSQVHGGGSGGAAGSSGWTKKKNTSSSSNSGGNNGGNSSDPSDEAEETEETFDWIEVKIQRIEEEIARLDERVENTYDIWSNRNKNLISEMESVREEIKIQQAGYERYLREADSVGLSEEYARKVRDGLIDIETIKNNEELVEQINLYQQWYNKAVECSDAVQTLTIRLGELSETNFNNLKTEFEETLSYFESYSNLIDERINRTEEKGYFVSKKYYEDLIGYEKQSLDTLRREYDGLVQRRNEAVASGTIAENSEAWHNMNQEILGVAKSIEEAATQLVTFDNKMRQIDWDVFDYTRDRIDFINDEFEFLIDLLDNQKLYDDWGIFNERGWSDTLLHASKYNIYMQESIEYAKERAKIEKELANDPANKTLIERREELIKLQQQSIQNSYAEKEAVKSLVEEGINIHLQKLSEVIEEYKRAINDAKSLYDYQKNIAKQTKNLTDLEKQLNAYAGDDSEEARATIQKLQKSLSEAQDELKETEWDKYISETETFLDDMYTEYSEVLNARLDDIDALMHSMIDEANARADEIKKTVETVSDEVGYDLTSSVEKLLGATETTKMVSDFKTRFDTYATTTQALMNEIKNYIASIANKQTQPAIEPKKIENDMKNVKPAQTPIKQNVTPVNTNTNANANKGSGSGSGNNSTGGDGKPNVGDRVKFMSGRYYQDSYGDGRSGNQYLGGEVYITKINTSGTKPYHISTGNRLGNGDLGWVTLSQLQGYKTGNPYTDDEWAWTQEEGQEMIYRASDGALLTPLDAGGKVFTHEMTDNLWDIAQYKPTPIIPNGGNAAKTITNNNAVNINLPNVQNYEQFKTALQNDPKMTQFIQQITLGEATNGIKLNKKRF